MPSTYSNLKIELIATGEQSGTWGVTTNTNLGTAIEQAITGSADVAFSSADVTLTLTDTNAAQTARNLRLNLTGISGGARNLILGSGCQIEKLYLINNGLADAVTVKNTTGTGAVVPAGASMFVFNNGTDVTDAVNALVTPVITAPAVIEGNTSSAALRITQLGTGNALLVEDAANPDSSPFVIDLVGDVGIGTDSPLYKLDVYDASSAFSVVRGNSDTQFIVSRASTDTSAPLLQLWKSRGTQASPTAVASGDITGHIQFFGYDGSNLLATAEIRSVVDGTPSTNDMPGRLVFSTTADGASTPTERMSIDSFGDVGIGTTSPLTRLEIAGSSSSTWSATASITGTTMDVTSVGAGTLAVGDLVHGTNVQPYTRITSFISGSGGAGTYEVSVSQTLSSGTVVGGPVYGNTLIRITDTDTAVGVQQPVGGLQFYTSDASTPTAGVGAYVAGVSESTTPDTALVFGTRDNAGNGVDANERMRITSSGNVGIGTSSPTFAAGGGLNVANSTFATMRARGGSSTGTDFAQGSDGKGYVYVRDNADLIVGTNDTERMRIDSSGNVGIGTSSPSNYSSTTSPALTVVGTVSGTNGLINSWDSTTGGAADVGGNISFGGNDGVTANRTFANIKGGKENSTSGNYAAYLSFSTRPNGSPLAERMRITSGGNVGIGTSSPTAEIELYKNSNLQVQFLIDNPNAGTAASTAVVLSPETGAAYFMAHSSTYTGSAITGGASGAGLYTSSNLTNGLSVGTTAGPLKFFAGSTSTERMRIDSNGLVGIGSAPSSGTQLYITAGSNIAIQSTQTGLTCQNIVSTDASASGLNIQYYKDSASPAANDFVSLLRSYGNSSTGVQREYSRISTQILSPTNAAETSAIRIYVMVAGTMTQKVLIDNDQFTAANAYTLTTASAANVNVDTSGTFARSTSSIKYKTDVEDLAEPNSANIYNMRPVWYRSTCDKDNKKWSWYGLIAEEVAELDPRLVHWGYADDQYDITYVENDGQKEEVKTLKENAVMQPEGVQYDRLTVLLIQEIKKLKAELDATKAEVAALNAK